MAGIYIPTTTFYLDGIFTIVSTTGTPYFVIQNSMGSYQYGVDDIYMQSNTAQQLLQGLSFRSYDANGDINNFLNATTVSPYQYQNSLFIKPIRNDIVLDGRTSVSFNLLPNENVNFTFLVTQYSNSMFLKEPKFLDDYFFKQQYDFFNGFIEKA
jgi:hypothetical protein